MRCSTLVAVILLCVRAASAVAAPATTQAVPDIAALNPIIPSVDFDNVTLERAISTLREQTGVNIVVRWHVVQKRGIFPETPVTLRVVGLRLEHVVRLLGWVVGNETASGLSARADRGVVFVSDAEGPPPTVLRVYDVRDLIRSDAVTYPRREDGGAALVTTAPTTQPLQRSAAASLERLRSIIMESIEPDSWRGAGGTEGSIHEFNGKLVISHTSAAHVQIADLLEKLRAN